MVDFKNLSIVPLDKIPVAGSAPTDNLLDIYRLVAGMEKICTEQDGIGLAAAQVGVSWNVLIISRNSQYEYYVNCEYVGNGEKQNSIEGCLSLRHADGNLRRFEVQRFPSIQLKGKQLKISDSPSLILEEVDREEAGLYAIVLQHELDHIYGRERMIDVIGKEIEIFRKEQNVKSKTT